MSYARIVNTEWSTKLTTTDVRSASANLTVSELSLIHISELTRRVNICLSANIAVSVSVSGNRAVSVSVSMSVRDRMHFSFLFDSVPRCHMPDM